MRMRFDPIYAYDSVNITEEAYSEIVRIIQNSLVCEQCGEPCNLPERPMVTLNLCPTCFIATYNQPHIEGRQKGRKFKAVRQVNEREYWFLNEIDSSIYVLDSHKAIGDIETLQSVHATLTFWRFMVPGCIDDNFAYSTIHGNLADVETQQAIVITTAQNANIFILYRMGEMVRITRKTKAMRELLEEAAAATTNPEYKRQPWPALARIASERRRAEQTRAQIRLI